MSVIVDYWVWPLDVEDAESERLRSLLSGEERDRAARFAFGRDQKRFIAAHGRVREILAMRMGRAPAALEFRCSEHGKPSLRDAGGCRFNLTHSEGIAALAICDGFEIGIDLEQLRPLAERVAEFYFSQCEVKALSRLPGSEQLVGFYRCWTRKEAIVKAIGEGLSRSLDTFDVSVIRAPAVVERLEGDPDASRNWRLAHFEGEGFVGAIACCTGGAD